MTPTAAARRVGAGATRTVRWRVLAAIAVIAGLVVSLALRGPILSAAGRSLVVEDPIERADIIVVAVDAGDAGVLEAADLVRGGTADRVAVFAYLPDPAVDGEFARRGIVWEDDAERSRRGLRLLGVAAPERIPTAVGGTNDQGTVLRAWCEENAFRSVVVVTRPDHSRRLRRVLRRAMKGHSTRIAVRPARHARLDPDQWWQSRAGLRTGIVELEKLVLDVALHPLS
jgi:hypothetical protein